MARIRVERFRPRHAAPADLAAWAAVAGDDRSGMAHALTDDSPGRSFWAARSATGGPILGAATLAPQPHDRRVGFLRLFTAAPHRRRGAGSALLAAALTGAAEQGLDRLQATVAAGPPGEPFARTCPDLRVLLRLELHEQPLDDPDTLARCRRIAAAPPPGYRLVQWSGAAPEPLAGSLGSVLGHVLDAPGAALQMQARRWDAAAVRRWESTMAAAGGHLLVSAAVDVSSGSVAAATVTTVPAAGGGGAAEQGTVPGGGGAAEQGTVPGGGLVADQHDTAVLPAHRRRGLARWIKAGQALRLHAAFPEVRSVAVTVNRENQPMLAVNRAVGYRRVRQRLLVEADVVRPPT